MKKKSTIPTLLTLIAALSLGAAGGYYYTQRQAPEKAAMTFLHSIRDMDFEKMSSMLQSQDLSLLEGTNIRDEIYADFFRKENAKISGEVVKNDFSLASGTAEITLRVNYVDGSEIYTSAMNKLLTNLKSASLKEKKLNKKEITQSLADAIMSASEEQDQHFIITDLSLPMVSIDGEWKVVTLDPETLKVMSSNFTTAEKELYDNITALQNGDNVELETLVDDSERIDLETDNFTLKFTQARISSDFVGMPCLMIYYDFTNNSDKAISPMITVQLQAFQSGTSLEGAIPETAEDALNYYMSEVAPGQTINVCQPFALIGNSEVTLKAADANIIGGKVTSQIINIP